MTFFWRTTGYYWYLSPLRTSAKYEAGTVVQVVANIMASALESYVNSILGLKRMKKLLKLMLLVCNLRESILMRS